MSIATCSRNNTSRQYHCNLYSNHVSHVSHVSHCLQCIAHIHQGTVHSSNFRGLEHLQVSTLKNARYEHAIEPFREVKAYLAGSFLVLSFASLLLNSTRAQSIGSNSGGPTGNAESSGCPCLALRCLSLARMRLWLLRLGLGSLLSLRSWRCHQVDSWTRPSW